MIDYFSEVVGQQQIKKTLGFFLENYQKDQIFPHLFLGGSYGDGKTLICRNIAKNLIEYKNGVPEKMSNGHRKVKTLIEINCSTLSSLNSFVDRVLIPLVQDKYVTLFFDEASEIGKEIIFALLTMLPTGQTCSEYIHNGYKIELDFSKQTFLFASSEPNKLWKPFLSRLERLDLVSYATKEIAGIVQTTCPEIEFENGVLESIASMSRGNGRSANKLGTRVKEYLKGQKKFFKKDWDNLRDVLGILPFGISNLELSIMRHLYDNPDGVSLTSLSARTNLSPEALRGDAELFLLRTGLIKIEQAKGRKLTARGLQYIKDLKME